MHLIKSTIAGAAIVASLMSVMVVAPAGAASHNNAVHSNLKVAKPQIGLGLRTNRVSPTTLRSKIRQQVMAKGLKLSSAELNEAVNAATNKLASAGNGPQKGIIHLKFRRFTICISWGADKGHC